MSKAGGSAKGGCHHCLVQSIELRVLAMHGNKDFAPCSLSNSNGL